MLEKNNAKQSDIDDLKNQCAVTDAPICNVPTKDLIKLQVGSSMQEGYEAQGMSKEEASKKVDEECEKLANTDNPLKNQLEKEKEELNSMGAEFTDLAPSIATDLASGMAGCVGPAAGSSLGIYMGIRKHANLLKRILGLVLGKISFLKVAFAIPAATLTSLKVGIGIVNGVLASPPPSLPDTEEGEKGEGNGG